MKKKPQNSSNYAVFYLFLILFFGWILTQFIFINQNNLIVTNNQITGLAPIDISSSISNALDLMQQVFGPLFSGIGSDNSGIFLRIIYGMVLFFILWPILRKVLPDDKESRISRSSLISFIISISVVSFTPTEWVFLIAESTLVFFAIALILGGLYFIYVFRRNEENRFIYFIKAVLSLVMFFLIQYLSNYSRTSLTTTGIIDFVISIGLIVSILFFIWYLFIKTATGGATAEQENLQMGTDLARAAGSYGGLRNLFGRRQRTQPLGRQSNQPQRGGTQQQTQPQQAQQRQQATTAKVRQNLQNYYANMQAAHNIILNQIQGNNPNLNQIRNSLTVIRNGSALVIRDLGNSGLQGPNVVAVLSLARSINTSSGNILRNLNRLSTTQLRVNYNRVIGQQLPNMQRPIRAL